ncbi:MAG: tetratricopeptide repeat protein [Candidatus Competibacter sp.]
MRAYVGFLYQQSGQNAELAATLTGLELPNLFALLDRVQRAGDAEATIDLTTSLYSLLQNAGKPRLLARVGQVRDAAAAALGDAWNHARFEAARTRIEQQLAGGRLREAFDGAQALLQRARAAGEQAYPDADYDLAGACWLLARVLQTAGGSEPALPLLDEARQRFEAIAQERANKAAERMASACLTEQGDCLLDLGRLDEAAAAYEEAIRRAEQRGDDRKCRRRQRPAWDRPPAVSAATRRRWRRMPKRASGSPLWTNRASVATSWHQTGMAYQDAGQPEAAEDAYRKSLAIKVRLGDVAGQASTLGQLGNLYGNVLDRPEEARRLFPASGGQVCRDWRYGDGRHREEQSRHDPAQASPAGRSAAGNPPGHRMQSTVRPRVQALEDLGDSRRHRDGRRQPRRRGGGESARPSPATSPTAATAARITTGAGRLVFDVTQVLRAGDPAAAASLPPATRPPTPRLPGFARFIRALQAIVAGSRDRTLADAPDLPYR